MNKQIHPHQIKTNVEFILPHFGRSKTELQIGAVCHVGAIVRVSGVVVGVAFISMTELEELW